jgi:hypothetical protein
MEKLRFVQRALQPELMLTKTGLPQNCRQRMRLIRCPIPLSRLPHEIDHEQVRVRRRFASTDPQPLQSLDSAELTVGEKLSE